MKTRALEAAYDGAVNDWINADDTDTRAALERFGVDFGTRPLRGE